MIHSSDTWKKLFSEKGVLYENNGDRDKIHFDLGDSRHSDGHFFRDRLFSDEGMLGHATSDLLERFMEDERIKVDIGDIDIVVSLQEEIAKSFSEEIGIRRGVRCARYSPTEIENNGVKSISLDNHEREFIGSRRILLCGDVLTTVNDFDVMSNAIESAGGEVLPYTLVFLNRSTKSFLGKRKVLSLVHHFIRLWNTKTETCPNCYVGSEAIPVSGVLQFS